VTGGVGDAAAYNKSDVRQRLAFLHTPLREKWGMSDVINCMVRIGLSGQIVGHNITYPLLTKWVWSASGSL